MEAIIQDAKHSSQKPRGVSKEIQSHKSYGISAKLIGGGSQSVEKEVIAHDPKHTSSSVTCSRVSVMARAYMAASGRDSLIFIDDVIGYWLVKTRDGQISNVYLLCISKLLLTYKAGWSAA